MASGTPIIRQMNWFALIPQLGLFVGLIFIFKFLGLSRPSLVALAAYLILVYGLRFFSGKALARSFPRHFPAQLIQSFLQRNGFGKHCLLLFPTRKRCGS